MRKSVLTFSFGVSLSLALVTASDAHAARPPLAQSLSGDARALYDGGREAFKAGDFATAFAKFKRAHELSNDPRLLWNLAACERKSKHNANVMRLIEQYLREGEGWIEESEREEAAKAKAAVRAFVAAAKLETDPADGVDVFVDDVKLATSPVSAPLWIDQGSHRVRFSREGYRTIERSEDIPAGAELAWSIKLEPIGGDKSNAPAPTTTTAPALATKPVPDADTAPRSSSKGPLILTLAGLGLAAAGGALLYVSSSEYGNLRDDCGTACDPARWEKYRTLETVGDVVLITGGVTLVSGVVWWLASR